MSIAKACGASLSYFLEDAWTLQLGASQVQDHGPGAYLRHETFSLGVSYQAQNKPVAYGSAYVGIPIPLQNETWKCQVCGGEWDDQDSEQAL